ncbi:MAG: hypothetical protein KGQ26_08060 [Rhodospirillales bacterium]|nr:hypothetical protein [Rhodospirillales bacterium]
MKLIPPPLQPDSENNAKANLTSALAVAGGFAVVSLVAFLLCLPFIRSVYWMGDEGVLLRGGAELLAGHKIYTNFFAFLPPGGYLLLAGWMKLFGPSFLGIRLFAILNIAGIAACAYLACILASGNAVLSVFLALAWLLTSPSTSDVVINHHFLTTWLGLLAFVFALRAIRQNRATGLGLASLAGVMGGAAAMVTSSCGLWALLATAASFLSARRLPWPFLACLAGGLLAPLCCLAYIVYSGAFIPAFNDIVVNTFTRYSAIQHVAYGAGARWFVVNTYIFPLAGLGTLALLIRAPRYYISDPSLLCCVWFALAGFAGIFPRPDIYHIVNTEPLALPLIAFCATKLTANWRPFQRRLVLELALIWCFPPTIVFIQNARAAIAAPTYDTPRGPIALLGDERAGDDAVFSFLATKPATDGFFFYPYMPLMPFLAERPQTSLYDIFTPGYTTRAQYFNACQDVMLKAKWLILDKAAMNPARLRQVYPALKNASPPETRGFEHALAVNFKPVKRLGVFEIEQKLPSPDLIACNAVLH